MYHFNWCIRIEGRRKMAASGLLMLKMSSSRFLFLAMMEALSRSCSKAVSVYRSRPESIVILTGSMNWYRSGWRTYFPASVKSGKIRLYSETQTNLETSLDLAAVFVFVSRSDDDFLLAAGRFFLFFFVNSLPLISSLFVLQQQPQGSTRAQRARYVSDVCLAVEVFSLRLLSTAAIL